MPARGMEKTEKGRQPKQGTLLTQLALRVTGVKPAWEITAARVECFCVIPLVTPWLFCPNMGARQALR